MIEFFKNIISPLSDTKVLYDWRLYSGLNHGWLSKCLARPAYGWSIVFALFSTAYYMVKVVLKPNLDLQWASVTVTEHVRLGGWSAVIVCLISQILIRYHRRWWYFSSSPFSCLCIFGASECQGYVRVTLLVRSLWLWQSVHMEVCIFIWLFVCQGSCYRFLCLF